MNNYADKVKKLLQTGFFHIFGSSVINKIVAFLSSVILVRILTKSEYGVFTYAWNIYSIVLLANGFGMESGILQMCSEHSGDEEFAKKVCNYGSKTGILFDLALSVILFCIGIFAPLTISGAGALIRLLSCLPMVQFLFQLSTAYLRSQKRNQEFARLTVMNTIVLFLSSAGGAHIFREKGMVLGYYIAYSASVLMAFAFMNVKLISKEKRLDDKSRKSLREISFVSMCNNGLSQLMYLLDVFVLGTVAAEETVLASYKVATTIPAALTFIPLSLITYLYPYFAEHRSDGQWCLKKYKQVLLCLGTLNAVVSVGLFIFAPLVIRLLYGEQYLDAVLVFRILAINYFVSGTFRILSGNLLVTQRKLKFNLFVALMSGCVNIVADFLFIQWWGAVGAAYATVMVVIMSSVMSTSYLYHTFKKSGKTKA